MDYFMPTHLFTGDDCIARNAGALKAIGGSCLIATGKHAAKASGAMDDVERALESQGIAYTIWDGVTENPPVASCIEAGHLAAERGAEFILGVGGGSALDASKAIAVFAANPELDEAGFYAKAWANDPMPIVLVGTTAGTGSEVTKVSVLTDSIARKHSIHDDRLFATVSYGDPRYTGSCSHTTTLTCGVDILAHATEGYFSNKCDEISRAYAVRAIRMLVGPLSRAAAGEELTHEERETLYEASILGGLTINTTGTCFPHNVGYYLTENYHVPHGFACAIFMPEMLERVRAYDPAYTAAFFDEIGYDEATIVGLVESCLPDYGIRMTAEQIEEALPRWKDNGSVKNTRAEITVDTVRDILNKMFVQQ